MIEFLKILCSKCGKEIWTIFEPCPHCGYQLSLTEAGKKWQKQLRKNKGSADKSFKDSGSDMK